MTTYITFPYRKSEMSGASVLRTSHGRSVGRWVGCSQNSLTRANGDLASEYPQVKRGSAHTCAATLLLRQGSRPEVGFEYLLTSPEAWRPSGGYIEW
jgi:hypothetical protein